LTLGCDAINVALTQAGGGRVAHLVNAGIVLLNRLRGVAAVATFLGVLAGPAVAASAAPPAATLTLQPASGNAGTSITATFRVHRSGGDDSDDDEDCDLTTMFRWDGHLLNAHFTDGCTAHYSCLPLPGARAAGTHQVTAEDVHSGAKAAAVFTIVAPVRGQTATAGATTGGTMGRTMVNGSAGGRDGGEMATEPWPSSGAPAPLTYAGAGRIPTTGFPLSSWLIAAGTAIVVVGALVIVLIFPQLPAHQARHGRSPDQMRDSARSLMKQCSPN
jgi:hypothetical protein